MGIAKSGPLPGFLKVRLLGGQGSHGGWAVEGNALQNQGHFLDFHKWDYWEVQKAMEDGLKKIPSCMKCCNRKLMHQC